MKIKFYYKIFQSVRSGSKQLMQEVKKKGKI